MDNPENESVFSNIKLYAGAQKKQFSLNDYDLPFFIQKNESGWDKLKQVLNDHYRPYRGKPGKQASGKIQNLLNNRPGPAPINVTNAGTAQIPVARK